MQFGVTTTGLSDKEKSSVLNAVDLVSSKMGGILYTNSFFAFRSVYQGGITFQKSAQTCLEANSSSKHNCWGRTDKNPTSGSTTTIYSNSDVNDPDYIHFLIHEMGHAFDNAIGGELTSRWDQRTDPHKWFSGFQVMPTGNEGFASSSFGKNWIMGNYKDGLYEETANMFLGWVYNQWGENRARGDWMDFWMPYLLTGTSPDLSSPLQVNLIP